MALLKSSFIVLKWVSVVGFTENAIPANVCQTLIIHNSA